MGRNHDKTMGENDEETAVGPRFWTGSTSKFLSTNTGLHVSTMEARSSTLAGDFIVAEEPAGRMSFETGSKARAGLQQRSSWTMRWCRDDGIDLIVEELDRWWDESRKTKDKASKIEKALFETQRDVRMETTFMSHVARRKP